MTRNGIWLYNMEHVGDITISGTSSILSLIFCDHLVMVLKGSLWFIMVGDKGKGMRMQSFLDSHELDSRVQRQALWES